MKIWIHINNGQEGPFSLENLPLDKITPDTPVWHSGLTDWKKAGEVEEIASLLIKTDPFVGAEKANGPTNSAFVGDVEEIIEEVVVESQEGEKPAPQAFDPWEKGPEPSAPQPPTPPAAPASQPPQPPIPTSAPASQPPQPPVQVPAMQQPSQGPAMQQPPQGPAMQQPPMQGPGMAPPPMGYYPQQQYQAPPMGPAQRLRCPPDYLAWGIVTVLLCCSLPGIMVIINALRIQAKFRKGDMAGAHRLSQANEWWTIAAIVFGIVFYPFVAIAQLLIG